MSERVVWTYWISRDATAGVLSPNCRLWYRKPQRMRKDGDVRWLPTDRQDHGYIGEHATEQCAIWFRTIPETDLELIRFEMYPTERQIKDASEA